MLNALKKLLKKTPITPSSQASVKDSSLQGRQPEQWEVYKIRGNEHLANHELVLAKECYLQAIAINPEYADAYLNLGFVSMELKDLKSAEAFLEKALTLNSSLMDAYFLLGKINSEKNELEKAAANYKKVIELDPSFEIVYGDLCQVLFKKGELEKAIETIVNGINLAPHRPDYHAFKGNLHVHAGELAEALSCYEQALKLNPKDAKVLYNIGQVYTKQSNLLKARAYFERALHVDPNASSVLAELAGMAQKEQKSEEAIALYKQLIKLDPMNSGAHHELGNILLSQRKRDEAIVCYSEVVKLKPDDDAIRYLLDALKGEERSSGSSNYAEKLFDGYASNFNHHLTEVLQYQPQRLVDLLTTAPGFLEKKYEVLDLGCGTGLVGVAVKPYANSLVGVDVSGKMLSIAQNLQIYDRLVKKDLVAMMREEKEGSFDLILAGDVFLYLGKLEEVFEQAKRLLRFNGFFAFSVESLDSQQNLSAKELKKGYRLNVTARYAHSKQYIEELARSFKLQVEAAELNQLRIDSEKISIQGWFVVCRAL